MKESTHSKIVEHLTQLGPALLALFLSMWFFLAVGRDDASRNYPILQLERMANQGKLIKSSMEGFLSAGVPLSQYAGFSVMAERQLAQDPLIENIQVVDLNDQVLFSTEDQHAQWERHEKATAMVDNVNGKREVSYTLSGDDAFYQVRLPLNNKFETVGSVILLTSKGKVLAPMEDIFNKMSFACVVLILIYTLLLYWVREVLMKRQKWVLLICYLPFLVASSSLVTWGVESLYTHGVHQRMNGLSQTVASRLHNALSIGLALDDFSGLDNELAAVRKADANIEQILCVRGNEIVLAADTAFIGKPFTSAARRGGLLTDVGAESGLQVAVSMPDSRTSLGFKLKVQELFLPMLLATIISCLILFLVDHYLAIGFRTLKAPATFVLSLAFVLLFYVGLGEAYRGYPKLQLEKLSAQGDSIKLAMEGFLKAGVPLRQFGGFKTLANPLLSADNSISQIQVYDANGDLVFVEKGRLLVDQDGAIKQEDVYIPLDLEEQASKDHQFFESKGSYRTTIALNNKFEKVGTLVLTVHRSVIIEKIDMAFVRVAWWMLALILLFVSMLFAGDKLLKKPYANLPHVCYGVVFLCAASLVIFTLTGLYTQGIQAKTKALSGSLGKRLEAATTLGLPLSDFVGIEETFNDYKSRNPELSAIALTEGELIRVHTDAGQLNQNYLPEPASFTHSTALSAPGDAADSAFTISVSIPRKEVRNRLLRAIKNFLVLFVATALLAALFLNLISILGRQKGLYEANDSDASAGDLELVLVKILFFMVVFVEGLFASFLPLYLQDIAAAGVQDPGSASLLFTAYFAAFALSLIPSGNYAERHGVKLLMIWGVLITAISAYGMTLVTDFYLVMLLRILAGISQGMIFIGVQAFVLQVTSRGKTTQGTSVIVYGYNTGMISGTAIGALLVLYMGSFAVFKIGASISLFIFAFILFLIPEVGTKKKVERDKSRLTALIDWFKMLSVLLRDISFIKTIVLIGLTTKATMTGIVVYALPLIMARIGYPQDDIGQALMFYAAGVLLTNIYIPKLADRMGNTAMILFLGSIGSGIGLVMMGLIGMPFLAGGGLAKTLMLISGIFILGIAHGFIHAPIVTHIAYTRAASALGKSTTTSIYRFLERIGHVIGPMVVGHMLIVSDYSTMTFSYIGAALAVFGLLFLLLRLPGTPMGKPAVSGDST